MWYGLLDGRVCFETKAKSQKAVNLRRDPRISFSVEAGESYDQLRGVEVEGLATIIDDASSDEYWAAAVSVFERYQGTYTEAMRPLVEQMMNKRVLSGSSGTRPVLGPPQAGPGRDARRRDDEYR